MKQKKNIVEVTQFCKVCLPFKYLGVPLNSMKLSVNKCLPLIERFVGRIKHWSANFLSYVDILQLFKSMIFGISAYWLPVFALPKNVLNYIVSLCRTMWCERQIINRKTHVVWHSVCD